MTDGFITQEQKLSFREIVLGHLKKILELSCNEFRGGFYTTTHSRGTSSEEYVPDSRKQYIQAIESLHDVLIPHFDKEMGEKSKEHNEEVKEKLKEAKESFNKMDEYKQPQWGNYWSAIKIDFVRGLFQELNYLLKRIDYLKKAIFEEEDLKEEELIDTDK